MSNGVHIRLRENGPIVIEGPATIYDHLGNAFPIPAGKDKVALCRCGQSQNRPFCDGTHKTCGFLAAEIAVPVQQSP